MHNSTMPPKPETVPKAKLVPVRFAKLGEKRPVPLKVLARRREGTPGGREQGLPAFGARLLCAALLPCLAALVLAPGCASHRSTNTTPRPGSGIAEYRRMATEADEAVQGALSSLAAVSAQSDRCSAGALSNLVVEVGHLQVGSFRIRARSETLLARGDAYFANWHKHMAQVQDEQVRALAERNRPRLQRSFDEIKRQSQAVEADFRPFLADLRKLRNALEKDPASLANSDSRARMEAAKQNGVQVEQRLASIHRELDVMTALITPPRREEENGNTL